MSDLARILAEQYLQEKEFMSWYAERLRRIEQQTGFRLDPNPDAPEHFYDYRAAYMHGAEPDSSGHWPSRFKREGHPRLFLNGKDTRRDDWTP